MAEMSLNQLGTQNALSVTTVAGSLTIPSGTTPAHALIYVANAPIRWRADGTAPTATSGMYVPANAWIDWTDPEVDYRAIINRVQFIRDTSAGGNATLEAAFFN